MIQKRLGEKDHEELINITFNYMKKNNLTTLEDTLTEIDSCWFEIASSFFQTDADKTQALRIQMYWKRNK